MGNDTPLLQHPIELRKQLFHDTGLGQRVLEQPDRFCIWNFIIQAEAKKAHEAHAVIDLVLSLIVRKVVQPLQNDDFEQQNAINRRSACIAFFSLESMQAR